MTPPTVNAYYDPQQNNVNFPAGYFQPPFFSDKEDDAANYGDMGSTVGHELTHGFDDEGRQFDATGNLKDWWTKDDEDKFTARADCMVKQYDAIEPSPACISTASSRWAKISPISAACGWPGSPGSTRRKPRTST
jgi:putative endopeptidase